MAIIKPLPLLISFSLLNTVPLWAAASLDSMQDELDSLRQQVELLTDDHDFIESTRQLPEREIGAPYFGIDATIEGDTLLIDEPNLNKDLGILRQRQYSDKKQDRPVSESAPRIQLSGFAAGELFYHSNEFGEDTSKSDITALAELDIAAFVNDWWQAYTKFEGNSAGTLSLDQAFVTAGNIDVLPVYGTIGRIYIPFGDFGTNMITKGLTRKIFRIRAESLAIGYANYGIMSSLFTFNGDNVKQSNQSKRLNQWGANLNFNTAQYYPDADWQMTLGASYVNNIANSGGIASKIIRSSSNTIQHRVPAYDVRALIAFRWLSLYTEYAAATKSFSSQDLIYNGKGAQPRAWATEVAYKFTAFNERPNTVAITYQTAHEGLWSQGFPKKQYGILHRTRLTDFAWLAFEYMHKKDYGRSTTGGSTTGTGRSDNSFSTEIDLFY